MTDDDIVGIRMTTPGDIKAFARAIEKKVRAEMIKIGQYYFNPSSITWIIEREVHFNNGKSIILTEPEIQDLFAHLFNEPRPSIMEAVEETMKDLSLDGEVKKAAKALADGIDKQALESLLTAKAKPKKVVKKK